MKKFADLRASFYAILTKTDTYREQITHKGNTLSGAYKLTLTITRLQFDTLQLRIACINKKNNYMNGRLNI